MRIFEPNPLQKLILSGILFFTNLGMNYTTSKLDAINPQSNIKIEQIYILSNDNKGEIPDDKNKIIDFETPVMLYAGIKINYKGERIFVSESDKIRIGNSMIDAKSPNEIPELEEMTIKWFKVESDSRGKYYDNASARGLWDYLKYKETTINQEGTKIKTDVAPTLLTPVKYKNQPIGTMRYKVIITLDGKNYSTPGIESRNPYGISENVHRISKKGHTGTIELDFALAMANSPYIWGSDSPSRKLQTDNQAERFLGADCADFAVAADRLAGNTFAKYDQIKYQCKTIVKIGYRKGKIFLDPNKEEIPWGESGVRPGDIIYWNYSIPGAGHVGRIFEDRSPKNSPTRGGPNGILDKTDLVIHTLFKEPRVEKIEDAFHSSNFKIYRYKN